jgi:hypothetical protein
MWRQKHLSNTLMMWMATLQEYEMRIVHVPVWTNCIPDWLSRYSVHLGLRDGHAQPMSMAVTTVAADRTERKAEADADVKAEKQREAEFEEKTEDEDAKVESIGRRHQANCSGDDLC